MAGKGRINILAASRLMTSPALYATFRANPKLDVVKAITELGVGEALVSVLDPKGSPTVVERAFVLPPRSRLIPLRFRSAP